MSGQAIVLAILAVLTAILVILVFRGAPGETVVFWLVLGCVPIELGTIAQTWKGRTGAAWWLLSLIVMLLSYFVTAASYAGPDARMTTYLAGALVLGALPMALIIASLPRLSRG